MKMLFKNKVNIKYNTETKAGVLLFLCLFENDNHFLCCIELKITFCVNIYKAAKPNLFCKSI